MHGHPIGNGADCNAHVVFTKERRAFDELLVLLVDILR